MVNQHKILVKHFSKDLDWLRQKLAIAIHVQQFGRKRALVYFASEDEAKKAFMQLQHEFKNTKMQAILPTNQQPGTKLKQKADKPATIQKRSKCTQTVRSVLDILPTPSTSMCEKAPPAFARYEYPKANMDIVDAISIELMTNTRFYTQVLHLMNNMNLEPPFGPKKANVKLPGRPKDAYTQTDHAPVAVVASSSESELEDESPRPLTLQYNEEKLKLKARQLLKSASLKTKPSVRKHKELNECFEENKVKRAKIVLNVPKSNDERQPAKHFEPPSDLTSQRLTKEQMLALPIYQNYVEGEPSNKLYIKNLAKNVTEQDLMAIYAPFIKNKCDLHVRVMQQGRMKGQAFVTFASNDMNNQLVSNEALAATNGFLLYEKPMVVCFGKTHTAV